MAGSNALSRGVPRRLLQGDGPSVPVIGAGQIPTIQYSSGNAKALQQFSRDLFSLGNQFEDQLDAQAEAESATAGAVAGASGNFELQTYGTIRGRAFNKAAVETYAANLDTGAMVKLNQLQQQYYNDPEKLQSEWSSYQAGVASELQKRSPQEAIAFQNRNTIRGMPAVEAARDERFRMTRSEADAALIANETALRSEVKNYGADLFSQNPERSRAATAAISQVREQFMSIYSATDPATGKPLYSPAERAKAQEWFKDTTMTEAGLGWFDAQDDKAGAYLKMASGDFKVKLAANNDQVQLVMANKGATRNDPLQPDIANRMKAAAAATGIPGVAVVVHSGGQETADEIRRTGGGRRTGSVRHDHGGAGDVKLAVNGKVLDFASNREAYIKFAENAAAAGLTGIGVDEAKGYLHLGGGKPAAWGYRGNANGRAYLPADFAQAIERGRGQKLDHEPTSTEVPIADMLSPEAFNRMDSEMRSRISFSNTMADRERVARERVEKATQDRTAFEYTNRIYAAGTTDPTTNQPIKPLTREEIIEAGRLGILSQDDGKTIMKALTTEKPDVSDEPTIRDLEARIYAGEDVYRQVIDAGSKISAKDAGRLMGLNQSVVRNNLGEFSRDQKFYFEQLGERLRGGAGPLADLDPGSAARMSSGLEEFRKRVMDPENKETPDAIANDIATRANIMKKELFVDKLGSMVPPRGAVPLAGNPQRLDLAASAAALFAQYNAGTISEAAFQAEQKKLVEWGKLQTALDAPQPQKKGK